MKPGGARRPTLLASITAADPLRLADDVARLIEAGVDGIHVDVGDGRFVPDLGYGLPTIRALATLGLPLVDVHLMVEEPERILPLLPIEPTVQVAVHFEACPYPLRTLSLARNLGLRVGIALNPASSIDSLAYLADAIAFVNVLTTEPDFAGERMVRGAMERVTKIRACLPPGVSVEVDGGVTAETIRELVIRGADTIVVGRAIIGQPDARAAVERLRAALAG